VAVVTALLLTTLAITIVASLFWQQQVQVRSMENQRLQLQAKWILRGALDWSRLILREDARNSTADYLGEPWATPLADTRLDDYVEKGRSDSDTSDATLSGNVVDAQSRYNLNNLADNGTVKPAEVAVLERLLTNLHANPTLAKATADAVAAAQTKAISTGASTPKAPSPAAPPSAAGSGTTGAGLTGGVTNAQGAAAIALTQVDDLLAVPGFTVDAFNSVKDYVVILPGARPINVNTAPAEVIAARIATLSLADATALVAYRDRTYFLTLAQVAQALPGKQLPTNDLSVNTDFFIVYGKVRLDRATQEMRALIDRSGGNPKVLWIREN
jgi:general secretion pathway protein K